MRIVVRSGIESREFMPWDDYDRRQKGEFVVFEDAKGGSASGSRRRLLPLVT
jgi:hypothetical protein